MRPLRNLGRWGSFDSVARWTELSAMMARHKDWSVEKCMIEIKKADEKR